nr:hypothetical protein BaRGS_000883 [Batillaria attramentaria]
MYGDKERAMPDLEASDASLFEQHIWMTIVLVVYSVLGTALNMICVYVVRMHFSKETISVYIVVLAGLDLLYCLAVIPAEIFFLRNIQSLLNVESTCKADDFLVTWVDGMTTLTILIVAIDRGLRLVLSQAGLFSVRLIWSLVSSSALLCGAVATLQALEGRYVFLVYRDQQDNTITIKTCVFGDVVAQGSEQERRYVFPFRVWARTGCHIFILCLYLAMALLSSLINDNQDEDPGTSSVVGVDSVTSTTTTGSTRSYVATLFTRRGSPARLPAAGFAGLPLRAMSRATATVGGGGKLRPPDSAMSSLGSSDLPGRLPETSTTMSGEDSHQRRPAEAGTTVSGEDIQQRRPTEASITASAEDSQWRRSADGPPPAESPPKNGGGRGKRRVTVVTPMEEEAVAVVLTAADDRRLSSTFEDSTRPKTNAVPDVGRLIDNQRLMIAVDAAVVVFMRNNRHMDPASYATNDDLLKQVLQKYYRRDSLFLDRNQFFKEERSSPDPRGAVDPDGDSQSTPLKPEDISVGAIKEAVFRRARCAMKEARDIVQMRACGYVSARQMRTCGYVSATRQMRTCGYVSARQMRAWGYVSATKQMRACGYVSARQMRAWGYVSATRQMRTCGYVSARQMRACGYVSVRQMRTCGYVSVRQMRTCGYMSARQLRACGYMSVRQMRACGYMSARQMRACGYMSARQMRACGYMSARQMRACGYVSVRQMRACGYVSVRQLRACGYVSARQLRACGYVSARAQEAKKPIPKKNMKLTANEAFLRYAWYDLVRLHTAAIKPLIYLAVNPTFRSYWPCVNKCRSLYRRLWYS